jgi:hypothetical protein
MLNIYYKSVCYYNSTLFSLNPIKSYLYSA